jgi:hypothetical protein
VLPVGARQVAPPQQSALVVQVPQLGEHVCAEQTKGGEEPAGLGMHGRPLQQSALDAHAAPAPTQAAFVHRGTPTLSCRQVMPPFLLQLPEQQSHEALHEVVASLQTSPFGLQPWGLLQMPRLAPAALAHDPAALLQQSASSTQVSPTTWHPLAGWQM